MKYQLLRNDNILSDVQETAMYVKERGGKNIFQKVRIIGPNWAK